jgi:hypothetical protein
LSASLFIAFKIIIHCDQIDWTYSASEMKVAKPLALNLEVAPLYRLLALVMLVAAVMWVSGRFKSVVSRWFEKKWWDVGERKPDDKLSWADVFELASLAPSHDPIMMAGSETPLSSNGSTDGKEIRKDSAARPDVPLRSQAGGAAVLSFLVLIGIGGSTALALDYLIFPRVPNLIYFASDVQKNAFNAGHVIAASSNLTAYLALLAAAISIYFTYSQLRAKVRAESRQAWINEVRDGLSYIITGIAELFKDGRMDRAEFEELNRRRLHLELMLNPAEKDHRLLSLLIRMSLIPGIYIKGDDHVREQILSDPDLHERFKSTKYDNVKSQKLLLRIVEGQCGARDHANDTISFIVKLSHVVLKREWERVRDTR